MTEAEKKEEEELETRRLELLRVKFTSGLSEEERVELEEIRTRLDDLEEQSGDYLSHFEQLVERHEEVSEMILGLVQAVQQLEIGRPVSRDEALRVCHGIMERAEAERRALAEREARGSCDDPGDGAEG